MVGPSSKIKSAAANDVVLYIYTPDGGAASGHSECLISMIVFAMTNIIVIMISHCCLFHFIADTFGVHIIGLAYFVNDLRAHTPYCRSPVLPIAYERTTFVCCCEGCVPFPHIIQTRF